MAMLKQMTFEQAMKHKAAILEVRGGCSYINFEFAVLPCVLVQVAALAMQEKRNLLMAVLYDELIRCSLLLSTCGRECSAICL